MKALRRLLLLVGLVLAGASSAQSEIEVIELRYRQAEELIPLLRPQLDEAVRLSGQGDTLLVRAGAAELARIRDLIEQLDTRPRSLRISVRRGSESGGSRRGYGGAAEVELGERERLRGRVRIYSSEDASRSAKSQQVRVLEGRSAWIGESLILPLREQTVVVGGRGGAAYGEQLRYIELQDGFYARARVQGERVEVELLSRAQQPADGNRVVGQQVLTTVSGRLGEWLEVGAVDQSAKSAEGGILYRSEAASESRRSVELRVELAEQ